MEFSRKEYWSGLPFPSPGIETTSSAWQADSLPLSHQGSPQSLTDCWLAQENFWRQDNPYLFQDPHHHPQAILHLRVSGAVCGPMAKGQKERKLPHYKPRSLVSSHFCTLCESRFPYIWNQICPGILIKPKLTMPSSVSWPDHED